MERCINIIRRVLKKPEYLKLYFFRYFNMLKMWVTYLLILPFRNCIYKKNIWLIGEKGTEARDNGYWFYKYIRDNYSDINAYYVITKNSPDLMKVNQYKTVITQNSFKHFVYYLCAKVSANSQPFGAVPEPRGILYFLSRKIRRNDQIVIHLKHGITKDELPHILDYDKAHFDLICCVSERERIFMQKTMGYPEENIKTLGFCRFDNLLVEHEIKKQILIMPTHRMWLHAVDPKRKATTNEKRIFETSAFYKAYSTLLSNVEFLEYAREKGYKLVFYPHYALQSFIDCFEKESSDIVTIARREQYDVQQLLIESQLLITDYSSVFFDFSYMGKPVVFFQFDEEEYRKKHFKKGYFDYHKDGFGPVCTTIDEVVNEVKSLGNENFRVKGNYKQRVESFFHLQDMNNCKRVFEEVYRKAYTNE